MTNSMIMKQMQMAYMGALKGKEVKSEENCMYCWSDINSCSCQSYSSVKSDPFLNLTAEEFLYV